ncbi:MAG TPA: DUF3881 family protein [Blastocatellia bacterium]|nr:DUF3881 family protein [Blastocatellia bacterium]
MGECFEAIGLSLPNSAALDQLVEYVDTTGSRSSIYRRGAFIHGRCLRLGEGLEVWAVMHETKQGIFCADCRPGYRSTRLYGVSPWELTEVDEEGGAYLSGQLYGTSSHVNFGLQNLTEVDAQVFKKNSLNVSLAGLAYYCRILRRQKEPRLIMTSRGTENDYSICGPIVDYRIVRNPLSGGDIVIADVDVGLMNLEVLINLTDLNEAPQIGLTMRGSIWLQGHILDDRLLNNRYEGVDRETTSNNHWALFKREN